MKHIIRINGKLLEKCTPEERRQMDIAIIEAAHDVFGLVIPLDESDYAKDKPISVRGA